MATILHVKTCPLGASEEISSSQFLFWDPLQTLHTQIGKLPSNLKIDACDEGDGIGKPRDAVCC